MHDTADRDLIMAFEWEGALRSYLYRFSRNPDDVADWVQETYARVLIASRAGEISVHPIRAFLFRVARNLAIDGLRRRNVVPLLVSVGDFDRARVYSLAPSVEEHTSAQQELERLACAVGELPRRCREVFTLRKVYGFSQKEIASRLGIKEGTVERHISVAMAKLDAAFSQSTRTRTVVSSAGRARRRSDS
jgi:RNA polymerase sigma factor (sigma-70 family)